MTRYRNTRNNATLTDVAGYQIMETDAGWKFVTAPGGFHLFVNGVLSGFSARAPYDPTDRSKWIPDPTPNSHHGAV